MKVAVWCLVGVGRLPCALVAWGCPAFFRMPAAARPVPYYSDAVHGRYFRLRVGAGTLTMYPRPWAVALLAAGAVAVVASLAVLLHVPFSDGPD